MTSGLVPSLARRFADDLVPDASPAADGAIRSPGGDSVLLAALDAALCVLVGALGAREDPCADATTLLQPSPPPRPDELRGFVRVAGGWLGVAAVHDEQRGHVERVVADADRRGGTVAAVACRLQALGVAALPASAIGRAAVHESAWRRRRRVGPVLRVRGAAPLAGVRVLDLGRLVAGPLAGALLAELGAEVVALRPPGQPGATADVHTPAGRDLLADRFRWADLVVDNFSWRGWAQLRTTVGVTPRRHVGVRGFPATSPCRDWKVYGYLAEAATGLVRGRACRTGFVAAPDVPVVDRVAGILAAAVAVRALAAPSADAHVSLIGVARAIAAEAGAQREAY